MDNDEAKNSGDAVRSSVRRLARRTSSRIWEERPQTPAGWAVLTSFVLSAVLGYELRLQKRLTCPPHVFLQGGGSGDNPSLDNDTMKKIYERLTLKDGILAQVVQPSLWVGTRSTLASSLALVGSISSRPDKFFQFREILTVPLDGAKLALDWEVPCVKDKVLGSENSKERFLSQPIQKPVIVILHGINNDSKSGYIRSLQRTLTNRGKIAIGMNYRGCGGVPLAAPRGFSGAYTNDIRCVVHKLASRLAPGVPLFLVGFSLGANLVTKYLGEEGLNGTLPKCVMGGAALGNPLHIHSKNNLSLFFNCLIGQGVKLHLLENWKVWNDALVYPEIKRAMMTAIMATTVDQVDAAVAPVIIRNEPWYPYANKIGYENVEEFYADASSYRFIKHVSVPLLQIIAGDDKVVYHTFQQKLNYSISNPHVISVETNCGGHLGWQESPPPSNIAAEDRYGGGPSWASRATADFIDAILKTNDKVHSPPASTTVTSPRPFVKEESKTFQVWERPPPPMDNSFNINHSEISLPSTRKESIQVLQSKL